MLKHHITALALSLTIAAVTQTAIMAQDAEPVATIEQTEALPNGQKDVEGDWVNSTETNTVRESAIAQKMTQAEKARNAAENDKYGGAITIIAMCIVISALVILSVLFLGFGKISAALMSRKKHAVTGINPSEADETHEAVDSGEVIAAIAAALAEHFGQGHDLEDTILTIRRMKRAYSPWNSKIYNLRQAPELHRNPRR